MIRVDKDPVQLTGRNDGPGAEHTRWFRQITPLAGASAQDIEGYDAVLVGFASDEGVRRNKGRQGAKKAPAALRAAFAPLAVSATQYAIRIADIGDIEVTDTRLEEGQARLGETVATIIDSAALPIVLGGGHEVAFGTYSGAASSAQRAGKRIGILNLDAHFDLRAGEQPSSGTPFRQALEAEAAAGTEASYAVVGISQPSNTQALFDTAEEYGVHYLLDEDCQAGHKEQVVDFIKKFIARIDLLYLTVDLDVLPASTAPGVSAPAAFGVPLEVILAAVATAAGSNKLVAADIAEMNPDYDIDSRTAKSAARIIHTIITGYAAIR